MVRALALGARAVFVGRPLLYGLAALGDEGAPYVIGMLLEEFRSQLGSVGVKCLSELEQVELRHLTAWPAAVTH